MRPQPYQKEKKEPMRRTGKQKMKSWDLDSKQESGEEPMQESTESEEDLYPKKREFTRMREKEGRSGMKDRSPDEGYRADRSRSPQNMPRPKDVRDINVEKSVPKKFRREEDEWESILMSESEDEEVSESQMMMEKYRPKLLRTDGRNLRMEKERSRDTRESTCPALGRCRTLVNEGKMQREKEMKNLGEALSRLGGVSTSPAKQTTRNIKLPFPKQFAGNPDQLQEFETKFRAYTSFVRVDEEEACELLGSYLTEEAARWFQKLPPEKKLTLKSLFKELRKRFSPEQRKKEIIDPRGDGAQNG